MTVDICTTACAFGNYSYAGVQYSTYCLCGNQYPVGGPVTESSSTCGMRAGGNPNQYGGGSYFNSVYRTFAYQTQNYLGCFGPGYLPYTATTVGSWTGQPGRNQYLTPTICIDACSTAGYAYAAIQYSTYCFCGNSYTSLNPLPASSCNMGCGGETSTMCGGPLANSIWSTRGSGSSATSLGTGSINSVSKYDAATFAWVASYLGALQNMRGRFPSSATLSTSNGVSDYEWIIMEAKLYAGLEENVYWSALNTHQGSTSWVASPTMRTATASDSAGLSAKRTNIYYTYYLTGSAALVGSYPALASVAHAFA